MKKKDILNEVLNEVQAETRKARKAKDRGAWIMGRWERQHDGALRWIIPRFIPGPGG
jgi:hypothetical protein